MNKPITLTGEEKYLTRDAIENYIKTLVDKIGKTKDREQNRKTAMTINKLRLIKEIIME